jgi:hypothetical protein
MADFSQNIKLFKLYGFDVKLHREINLKRCIAVDIVYRLTGTMSLDIPNDTEHPIDLSVSADVCLILCEEGNNIKVYNRQVPFTVIVYIDSQHNYWLVTQNATSSSSKNQTVQHYRTGEYITKFGKYSPIVENLISNVHMSLNNKSVI